MKRNDKKQAIIKSCDLCRTCLHRNECNNFYKDKDLSPEYIKQNCIGYKISQAIKEILSQPGHYAIAPNLNYGKMTDAEFKTQFNPQ